MRQAALDAVSELAAMPRARPARRSGRGRHVPALDRGQPFHLPGLPPLQAMAAASAARSATTSWPGSGLGHPARDDERAVRSAPAGPCGAGQLRGLAGAVAGAEERPAVARASRRRHGRDRGQELRRQGKVTGERRFVGLFTSSAYHAAPRDIPLLRRKVERGLARAGFDPASHDGKALHNILETYPRDELFQIRRGHAVRHRDGRAAPAGAPAHGTVRAPRRRRSASSPAWSMRRASATTATCASASRRSCERAYRRHGSGILRSLARVDPGPRAVQRCARLIPWPSCPSRPTRSKSELAEAARTWSDRLQAGAGRAPWRGRGLDLARRMAASFPPAYREAFDGVNAARDLAQACRSRADSAQHRPLSPPEQGGTRWD